MGKHTQGVQVICLWPHSRQAGGAAFEAGFELQSDFRADLLNLCTTLPLVRGTSMISGNSQPLPTPDKAWNGVPEL